jgi:HlyD family secretion protein
MTNSEQMPPPPPRKRILVFVLMPVVALLGLGGYLHWRTYADAAETKLDQENFVPQVRTAVAQKLDTPVDLILPGQTEAFDAANLYPRATGYIAERRVDIGSRVHKDDLLVRIEAPDLDQQLAQAQAQLGQSQAAVLQAQAQVQSAQANTKLANVSKYRETTLADQGWETKQNADNATANFSVQTAGIANAEAGVAVALANLKAQQATIDRLQALTAFEQVKAPFDGVITARNVDTGDLLTQDSLGGNPMFSIVRDDVLRIVVNVPQSSAIGIHDGVEAQVTVPEMPGRIFKGRVARSAVALQSSSRSMRTEVDVPNPDQVLRPGLFVDVTFSIPRQTPAVVVPDAALVFNAGGLQVATVGADDAIHFQKVTIYRDFGTTAELRAGLAGGENLVLSPPVELADGSKVQVANPPQQQEGVKRTASRRRLPASGRPPFICRDPTEPIELLCRHDQSSRRQIDDRPKRRRPVRLNQGASRREDASMLRTFEPAPVQARPTNDSQEPALLDPLLRLAGNIQNTHALIVAEHGLDLMCCLIRHGCLAATILRIGDKPDTSDYDLVLVPRAAALPSADEVIRVARRSLAPRGRLIVGVRGGKASAALARRLRLNGFTGLHSAQWFGLTLLRADLRSVS